MAAESILLTGGAGFIGSNFAHRAVQVFDNVYILDKLTYAGSKDNLKGILDQVTFIKGDIINRDELLSVYESVEYVVNFAAESHVDRSISSANEFIESNVLGAYVAIDALRDAEINRFVQFSTDEVYGSIEEGTFDESARLDPSSPYSASKASADLFANAMWKTYGLPITIVRPTNVYGPRQHPEKLIPKFTLRALEGKSLPLYGDGTNVRQWLYISDLCEALLSVLNTDRDTIYNIAGPSRHSNIEVVQEVINQVGATMDLVEFVSDRKGHDYRYALDGNQLRTKLDYEPSVTFEEGIAKTVEWYKNHNRRFK